MKTIKEAAGDSYTIEVHDNKCNAGITFAKSMFKCGVEFAQRWIPVEEELPVPDTLILVKTALGDVYTVFRRLPLFYMSNVGSRFNKVEITGVTHWRPIELK